MEEMQRRTTKQCNMKVKMYYDRRKDEEHTTLWGEPLRISA